MPVRISRAGLLRAAADQEGWVAEELEAISSPTSCVTSTPERRGLCGDRDRADGTFVVELRWTGRPSRSAGDPDRGVRLIGAIAEGSPRSSSRPTAGPTFEVVTGMLAVQTEFAPHGHTLRLRIDAGRLAENRDMSPSGEAGRRRIGSSSVAGSPAVRRAASASTRGPPDARRPAQLPPLPAAALPGRDRRPVARRHRPAAALGAAQAAQHDGHPRRGGRPRPRPAGGPAGRRRTDRLRHAGRRDRRPPHLLRPPRVGRHRARAQDDRGRHSRSGGGS